MSVRAVLAVWSLALGAAAGGVVLILASDRPRPVASIPLEVLVGLAFVGSGLLARVRRPENRTGLLMMLVGFAWFGGALTAADQSLPYTIGYVEGALIGALFVHLVLAFPSGRLETKAERRVTAGIYVFALVLQPALLLFDDLHGLKCDACPENALLVDRNDTLAVVLGLPTLAFVLGILVAVVVILVRRWQAATAPLRRVLAPVYLSAGTTVVILVVRTAVEPFSSFGGDALEWLSVLALFTVPLSFLAGLLRSRLARSAVGGARRGARRRAGSGKTSGRARTRARRPLARACLLAAR